MGKGKKMMKQKESAISNLLGYTHNVIMRLNQSKIFAGIMIITLNIASRFVNIKLSNSMESYLKYTFSKQILIFAIAWMGTRDIYVALIITLLYTLIMDVLFNEECAYCILPEQFTTYHEGLATMKKSEEEGNNKKENSKEDKEQSCKEALKEVKEILGKLEKEM
jgi:hypothetical protein